MAYRRRQGMARASTFKDEISHREPDEQKEHSKSMLKSSHTFNSTSSLAAQAIRASAAHRESSLSSAYTAAGTSTGDSLPQKAKVFDAYEDSSMGSDSKGFWGVLARKAKAILEDDNNMPQQLQTTTPSKSSRFQMSDPLSEESQQSNLASESFRRVDNPTIRKGLDRLTSSLNQIGDSFEKAFEEGRHIVENKTADIIQETRRLQIRRKDSQASGENLMQHIQPHNQMNHEDQLKASRDVAMATAAKAKLLLRELKTVKADLAFAKQRCSQLEEENKMLRENREKGGNHADDDLIRLQLETLLAEKSRLAHENSVYARENRFLREIVEYHQLTMQGVVYFDECTEEVTEVYPITRMLSVSPPSPISPPSPSEIDESATPFVTKEVLPVPDPPQEGLDLRTDSDVPPSSDVLILKEEEPISVPINNEDTKGTTTVLEEVAKPTKKASP